MNIQQNMFIFLCVKRHLRICRLPFNYEFVRVFGRLSNNWLHFNSAYRERTENKLIWNSISIKSLMSTWMKESSLWIQSLFYAKEAYFATHLYLDVKEMQYLLVYWTTILHRSLHWSIHLDPKPIRPLTV